MACKNSLGRCRAEPDSAERRHTADEAVGQHRHTFQRTAEEDAAEPGNIETAQLCQHVQCIGRVGLIFCDAAMDGVDERYGKMAEHNLNAELAFVLEKDKQEIKDIIHDML